MSILVIAINSHGSIIGGQECTSAADADKAEHEAIRDGAVVRIVRVPSAAALHTTYTEELRVLAVYAEPGTAIRFELPPETALWFADALDRVDRIEQTAEDVRILAASARMKLEAEARRLRFENCVGMAAAMLALFLAGVL